MESSNSNDDDYEPPRSPRRLSRKRVLIDALNKKARKKNKASPLDSFIKAARWIGRSQDPFTNFYAVFQVTMQQDEDDEGEDDGDAQAEQSGWASKEQREELTRIGTITAAMIPCFKMTGALGGARADDCGSLKEAGLVYAASEVGQDFLTPLIPFRASKDMSRGFRHPQLGRLLCPVKYLTEFDSNNAEFLQKLQDGRVKVTSQDLPTFLYENSECDPMEMDRGLCRSMILVRTWRHIFTSPSSATKNAPGPGRTKSGQAKLNGLEHITARTIAYAAIHVRWFLCGEDDWRVCDDDFDKEEFFRVIIALFEADLDDGWAKDTLSWWNSQVFLANPTTPILASSSNDLSTVLAQRRTRLMRGTRPTSTGGTPVNHEPVVPEEPPLLAPSRALRPSSELQDSPTLQPPACQQTPPHRLSPPEGPDRDPTPPPPVQRPPVQPSSSSGPGSGLTPPPPAQRPPVQPSSLGLDNGLTPPTPAQRPQVRPSSSSGLDGLDGRLTPPTRAQRPRVRPSSFEGANGGLTSLPPSQQRRPLPSPSSVPTRNATPGPSSPPKRRVNPRRKRR